MRVRDPEHRLDPRRQVLVPARLPLVGRKQERGDDEQPRRQFFRRCRQEAVQAGFELVERAVHAALAEPPGVIDPDLDGEHRRPYADGVPRPAGLQILDPVTAHPAVEDGRGLPARPGAQRLRDHPDIAVAEGRAVREVAARLRDGVADEQQPVVLREAHRVFSNRRGTGSGPQRPDRRTSGTIVHGRGPIVHEAPRASASRRPGGRPGEPRRAGVPGGDPPVPVRHGGDGRPAARRTVHDRGPDRLPGLRGRGRRGHDRVRPRGDSAGVQSVPSVPGVRGVRGVRGAGPEHRGHGGGSPPP